MTLTNLLTKLDYYNHTKHIRYARIDGVTTTNYREIDPHTKITHWTILNNVLCITTSKG